MPTKHNIDGVPEGAEEIDVSRLLLDLQNPRLTEYGITLHSTQHDLVKVLWDKMAVSELAMSIAFSGFFPYEPLFVEKSSAGRFVVVEGNRRLAAVKILLDPDLRKFVGATDLPTIDASRRRSLEKLPCIVSTRKLLWQYLGFKHVNGSSPWGSYAKAQYVAHIHNDYDVPLSRIAAQIGDLNSTVERMYRGLMLVQQAEDAGVFDRNDISKSRFPFNYIYTGMDYPGIAGFIGTLGKKQAVRKPVPNNKLKQLGELLGWLYGKRSSDKPSLIRSQNPDLKHLDEVLLSDDGIRALRNGFPLAVARDLATGDRKLFVQYLQASKANLQRAMGTLATGYDPQDLESAKVASDIEILAHDLVDGIRSKARDQSRGVRRIK